MVSISGIEKYLSLSLSLSLSFFLSFFLAFLYAPEATNVPFVLELVPQLEHLDFDLALPVMLENPLVGLPLAMLQVVEVAGVGGPSVAVARLHVREVALHVTRSATASRRR